MNAIPNTSAAEPMLAIRHLPAKPIGTVQRCRRCGYLLVDFERDRRYQNGDAGPIFFNPTKPLLELGDGAWVPERHPLVDIEPENCAADVAPRIDFQRFVQAVRDHDPHAFIQDFVPAVLRNDPESPFLMANLAARVWSEEIPNESRVMAKVRAKRFQKGSGFGPTYDAVFEIFVGLSLLMMERQDHRVERQDQQLLAAAGTY